MLTPSFCDSLGVKLEKMPDNQALLEKAEGFLCFCSCRACASISWGLRVCVDLLAWMMKHRMGRWVGEKCHGVGFNSAPLTPKNSACSTGAQRQGWPPLGGLFQCLAVGQHRAGGTRVIHDHYAYRLLLVPPIYEAFMLIFFSFWD